MVSFDAAVAINIAPPYLDSLPIARGIADAADATGAPVAASFLPEAVTAEAAAYLQARGVLNFPTPERAVTALGGMARWRKGTRLDSDESAAATRKAGLPPQPILEPDAMLFLAEHGIASPIHLVAETEEEAAAAAGRVGFPCVMKVVSPDILHKSERGGVVVGIADEAAAREAFRVIRRRARDARFAGVIVYPQIRGAQEMLVGVMRDAQFGPVVACGLGGIYTELLKDVALRVAPVGEAEALDMIHSLKGYRILAGARGQPPCDVDALARMIARVSELPLLYPEIRELDLNPVFVSPEGAVPGDARIIAEA